MFCLQQFLKITKHNFYVLFKRGATWSLVNLSINVPQKNRIYPTIKFSDIHEILLIIAL